MTQLPKNHSIRSRSPKARASKPSARGFTLIEVMIVVAIIAILASVAIPSYREYILRGQMVDATNLLSTTQADMERHYQDNRTYATVGTAAAPCTKSPSLGKFSLTCTALSASAYTMAATGSGTVAAFTFTVTQSNDRTTAVAAGGPKGWNSGNCWLVKNGQKCS